MLLVTGYIHYKIKYHVYGTGRGRGRVVHALVYIKCAVLHLLFLLLFVNNYRWFFGKPMSSYSST